jgi:PHD/YefM family antitoxin component YafN of YafNO toxin-antitoxin module
VGEAEVQYISDETGETTAVIVPIALWRELQSERETAYLLKSETMKRRLLEARDRREGLSIEAVVKKFGSLIRHSSRISRGGSK